MATTMFSATPTEPVVQQLFDTAPPATGTSNVLPDIKGNARTSTSSVKSATLRRTATGAPVASANGRSRPEFPMTAAQALTRFKRVLTSYELEEIKSYPQIYYLGPLARKIHGSDQKPNNFGYDDEKSRYRCIKHDHIAYRYEILKGLGKGSFGDVVKTYDHKTKTHMALKIIRNERRFHKQGQVEVKLLETLRKQDKRDTHNLIHMKDYFVFRNHLCITFELLHADLYSALKKDQFAGFDLPKVRSFASSLVSCLRVLRKSRIIHCDLKPENILLKSSGSTAIKVIDFGSACYDHQRVHSYIQSRFYRSPEVILGASYGVPIDMWSLGCILAELYTGHPLFPGRDEKEQLMYQMEILGAPPQAFIANTKRASIFFNSSGQPRFLTDKKGRLHEPNTKTLSKALGCSDANFIDFVRRCLEWDPLKRMTPKEASQHPFIQPKKTMSRSISEGTRPPAMPQRSTLPRAQASKMVKKHASAPRSAPGSRGESTTTGGNTSASSTLKLPAISGSNRNKNSAIPSLPPVASTAAATNKVKTSRPQITVQDSRNALIATVRPKSAPFA